MSQARRRADRGVSFGWTGVVRRWRRVRRPVTAIGLAFALLVGYTVTASAVHDTGVFELDGNIRHDGTATYDWADLFTSTAGQAITPPSGPLLATNFLMDSTQPDSTYF